MAAAAAASSHILYNESGRAYYYPPGTTPRHHIRVFEAFEPGFEMAAMSQLVSPYYSIQPAVVCKDIRVGGEIDEIIATETALPIDIQSDIIGKMATRETISGTADYIIFNPILAEHVQDSYSDIEKIEDAPVYFFLISTFGHASIMIFYNATLYSLGLGLNITKSDGSMAADASVRGIESAAAAAGAGASAVNHAEGISGMLRQGLEAAYIGRQDFMGQGRIYSPDFLLKPGAFKSSGERYSYNLIDMGFFNRTHMNRIMSVFKGSNKNVDTNFFLTPSEGEEYTRHFDFYNIHLAKKYIYLSNRVVASTLGDYLNCVSFAQTVFRERVRCDSVKTIGIVDPHLCRSIILGKKAAVRAVLMNWVDIYFSSITPIVGTPLYNQLDTPISPKSRDAAAATAFAVLVEMLTSAAKGGSETAERMLKDMLEPAAKAPSAATASSSALHMWSAQSSGTPSATLHRRATHRSSALPAAAASSSSALHSWSAQSSGTPSAALHRSTTHRSSAMPAATAPSAALQRRSTHRSAAPAQQLTQTTSASTATQDYDACCSSRGTCSGCSIMGGGARSRKYSKRKQHKSRKNRKY